MKRAVVYLRVSTKEQARRDGNPEGYSLPTQRQTCQAKAEALGAVVVEEYLDKDTGTRTDKRPAMQALLHRVRTERDVDYVILFKLDRWARNAREDLVNDFILEEAGAELISCSETIDRSNAGRMMHTVLAANNEYQSRNMGDEIKRKMLIKIQEGGTHGVARIGYKNVGEGGRRYVVVDEERAPLITWLFEAYATGEWSVDDLRQEVTERGLRSRPGPNTPAKPLSNSQIHRILRSPYYKGIVVYNDIEYEGKHEHLVNVETWQRVQDVLASKANGEKQRTHHHYLKGTIWCGHCGERLIIAYAKGRGGTYPYYFCVGRQKKRTTCMLSYRPLGWVEAKIEDQYAYVKLVAEGLDRTGRAVLEELSAEQELLDAERKLQQRRLRQLEDERTKVLHAHYAGAVPLDLLKDEQIRIGNEISIAKARLASATASFERVEETVRIAVEKARSCHAAYLEASPHDRRLMNQAFFHRVWVTEDGVVGWDYNEPFATLMSAHGATVTKLPPTVAAPAEKPNRPASNNVVDLGAYQRRRPSQVAGALVSVPGSRQEQLAERVGFEPTERLNTPHFLSRKAPST